MHNKFDPSLRFNAEGIAQLNPQEREPHYEHAPANILEMQGLKPYESPVKHPKIHRKEGPAGKGFVKGK